MSRLRVCSTVQVVGVPKYVRSQGASPESQDSLLQILCGGDGGARACMISCQIRLSSASLVS